MGRISGLTDEVLIKILSFLPTKVAVSTSILSKQWEFLWMWLTTLEYNNLCYSEPECKRLQCFLHRNLPLHRAPIIESLRLNLDNLHFKPEDIKLWILTLVTRLRELDICYFSVPNEPDILPSSLYTCKLLVTLKLTGTILVDVPRMVCLPFLKSLRLHEVAYLNEGSLQRLLSICPILEYLSIGLCVGDDNIRRLTVNISSLLSLELFIPNQLDEFLINTPSVTHLKLCYYNTKIHHCSIGKMPYLMEASLDVCFPYIEKLIGSITNVKRLGLCIRNSSEALYGNGNVFNELDILRLCVCQECSLNVLVRFLKDSPNLRALDLFEMEGHERDYIVRWTEPSSVPKCMLSSLQFFKWSKYFGTRQERDLAVYILENARCLECVKILYQPCLVQSFFMLKPLAFCSRASTKCQLIFD